MSVTYRDRVADYLKSHAGQGSMADAEIAYRQRAEQAERERDTYKEALEIIAGHRQCVDNLMSNRDVAESALAAEHRAACAWPTPARTS